MNFTWWVNRKDSEGKNVFQGGFLGLDNIGIFDRSAPLPTGGFIEQSDGTSWMGMFSLNMMTIALELSRTNPAYENIATKFFEHFLSIADALNNLAGDGISLWDDEDEFFYDVLHLPDDHRMRLKVRSLVGLIPLAGGRNGRTGTARTVAGLPNEARMVSDQPARPGPPGFALARTGHGRTSACWLSCAATV